MILRILRKNKKIFPGNYYSSSYNSLVAANLHAHLYYFQNSAEVIMHTTLYQTE